MGNLYISQTIQVTSSISATRTVEVSGSDDGASSHPKTNTAIPFVDNIHCLRNINLAQLKTGATFGVYGYFALGDAHLPFYRWDETLSQPDNGGTIIKPESIPVSRLGRWVALYSGPVLASWFGVQGKASTMSADTRAMKKALSTGTDIVLDRNLFLDQHLSLQSNNSIVGSGAVKPKIICGTDLDTPFLIQIKSTSTNTKIENVEIDLDSKRHRKSNNAIDGIRVQKNCENFLLENCTIKSTGSTKDNASRGIIIYSTGISNINIKKNLFTNLGDCLYIRNGVRDIVIENNKFTQWFKRATFFVGDVDGPTNVKIINNTYEDPAKGYIKYPIEIGGVNNHRLKDLLVSNNTVKGPDLPWDKDDPSYNNATADQISIHYADGFIIENNISTYGGDVGITVARGAKNGIVRGNVTAFCDTDGIFIGNGAKNITVFGNMCYNNSKNRDKKHRSDNLGGIVCKGKAENIHIHGNNCYNQSGSVAATQTYGIIYDKTTTKKIKVENNMFSLNKKGDIRVIKK